MTKSAILLSKVNFDFNYLDNHKFKNVLTPCSNFWAMCVLSLGNCGLGKSFMACIKPQLRLHEAISSLAALP